ncbi:aldo/keto reductase [Brevibacterium marinum]|uniref:Diketogulonate reductase-like aldo/keto reductase n=1 Tax=Brevibacterium marinum TaxID=418643 RepID=A0A846RWT0_9MICO|nr:aldo/keto reductase [Brevibacterium marinum]NJC55348.1 diketogulonate reductase-like aldo/keto reductase [Brevibacterium marinum]
MSEPLPEAQVSDFLLNDGHTIPAIGLGTSELTGEAGVEAIAAGISNGYRLLDTAVNYDNEVEVGQAVAAGGVEREQLLVSNKVPGRHHGFEETVASTQESLARLGLDRLDLHLIHWPNPSVDRYVDTWRGLIDAQQRGLVRSIGVSNFTEPMLERLIDETGVTPAVNQVELHPYFPQPELLTFHRALGIRTQSWAPLRRAGSLLSEPVIIDIAKRHEVVPSEVVLRWHHELGSVPLPKSADPARQLLNLDIFDFALEPGEVEAISGLAQGRMQDRDPNAHEEM